MSEKTLYHQKNSADVSETFHLLKDVENRYFARKFRGRSYFSFGMVRWKKLQKENLKFPKSKLHTVQEKMLYHERYSTDFQKLSFSWKMWKIGIWAEKFRGRSNFSFAMVRWKPFLMVEKFEISHFQAIHCVRKNAISPKEFSRFSKTFHQLKDVENRYLSRKISLAQLF